MFGKTFVPSGGGGSSGREVSTADRIYYVSTTGSDSNDGKSAGSPFLTIPKAIDTAAALDILIYNVIIQLANGTYSITSPIYLKSPLGSGYLILRGDTTTPANVIIQSSGGGDISSIIASSQPGKFSLEGFQLKTTGTTYPNAIESYNSYIEFKNLDFNTGFWSHIWARPAGLILCTGNYTISGGAGQHLRGGNFGNISIQGFTTTLTGTPNFSSAWAYADLCSVLNISNTTYSGAATGKRYDIRDNAVCNSVATLPGSIAGTTDGFGVYI